MKKDNLVDTIEYKGYTIKVYPDDCPFDPRQDCDNLGIMATWHNRYNLGDIQPKDDPAHYLASLIYDKGGLSDDQLDSYYEDSIDDYLLKKFSKYFIWLPVYIYEHSGITISASRSYPYNDRWDSGTLGFIYVDKEKVKEEYSWKKLTSKRVEQIVNYLRSEVEYYDDYITGNVYGFTIEDNEGKEIDSCWGFIGDYDKYMLSECKSNIDHLINKHNKQSQAEHDYLFSNSPLYVGI